MSDIVLLSDSLDDLLPMTNRSPGLHVKAIVTDLAIQYGYLKGDRKFSSTWAVFGTIFEHAVSHMYSVKEPGRYVQIGEIERDGIYGTPDLIDIEEWIVEEIKLAWMSSLHSPESQEYWRYWTQLKAYIWMLRKWIEKDVNRGTLRVCHVNGDWSWKDESGPTAPKWQKTFSVQELAENWAMIKSHGERNRERLEEKAA